MDIKTQDVQLVWMDYHQLEPFQGDLKYLPEDEEEKLLKSMQEEGFFDPFKAWVQVGKDRKKTKRYFLLDGHQRLHTIVSRGITFNGGSTDVPVVLIHAETEDEARRKLLLINADYGKIDPEGLRDFTAGMDMDWIESTLSFDAIPSFDFLASAATMGEPASNKDLVSFVANGEEDPDADDPEDRDDYYTEEGDTVDETDYTNLNLVMTREDKNFIISRLNEVKQDNNLEKHTDALLHLINYYFNEEQQD